MFGSLYGHIGSYKLGNGPNLNGSGGLNINIVS